MLYYSDTTDTKYKEKSLIAEKLNEEVSNKLSFVDSEIFSKSYEDVISLLNEKDKEYYSFYLEKMFRYQKYILSENEEKVISEAINAFGTPESVFDEIDNTDVKFKPIIKDGKEIELNHSNYINFMRDKDRKVMVNSLGDGAWEVGAYFFMFIFLVSSTVV